VTHNRSIRTPISSQHPVTAWGLGHPALLQTFPSISTDIQSPFGFPDGLLATGRVSCSGVITSSRINIGGLHYSHFWNPVLFFPLRLLSIIPRTLVLWTRPGGGMILLLWETCLNPSWPPSRHISGAPKFCGRLPQTCPPA